jgi:O-antigen ligase
MEKSIFRKVIGRNFSVMFVSAFFMSLLLIFSLSFHYFDVFLRYFGKEITFTGRIDLWASIFENTRNYLLQGCGFGSFWIGQSATLDMLYTDYPWLPNQAHMGYLDLLNETGLIGIFLLNLMIINYAKNLSKLDKPHFFKWFFIAALILNLSESTLFRQNLLTGVLFIFSYIALYREITLNLEMDRKLIKRL